MSEKKELNQEQLEKANGGAPYSPPEYDDYDDDYCPNFKKPVDKGDKGDK